MFQYALSTTRKSIITRSISESKSSLKGIQSTPLLIDMNQGKDVPLCINCKYFNKHPKLKESNYGKCHKFGELDVIDGTIHYKLVETARQYFCHGNDFESKISSDAESYKDFLK